MASQTMMRTIQTFILLVLCSLAAFAKTPPTIYLAGDSTMAPKQPDKRPETGWGEYLGEFFQPNQVVIANQAMNGRSTKSFIAEGRWQKLADALKPGDYVFIQFGHNDESKDKAERYTPPADYKANLTRMVVEVRAKQAFPVLLTPVSRRRYNPQGEFYDTHGAYPDLVRAVAKETNTPLLDLHRRSEAVMRRLGPVDSVPLFMNLKPEESANYLKGLDDNTHFRPVGAEVMARLAADAMLDAKLPLARYLRQPLPMPDALTAQPLSEQMADTAMRRIWVDERNQPGIPPKWLYDFGVISNGLRPLWYATGDRKYFDHIKKGVDTFVNDDGTIRTYTAEEYNIDQVLMGRAVLLVYRVTGEAKYKKAADLLRSQLKNHPRTKEGGFWHKKIYPFQMWLDGLYMGQPFLAEYSEIFHEPQTFDDIVNQFVWMEKHARDDKTGLLYHAWDESKQMPWADKVTGRAPMFWGRALGWYAMALVDTLDYLPAQHPRRQELISILNREMTALAKVQDKKSGTWYLIVDRPNAKGNYLEASAACMFTYALAKGVRLGYLPASFAKNADRAWAGVQKEFLSRTPEGFLNLEKTISVAGLGGKPYRDGSYEYYLSEKIQQNDPKGVGAFIKAAVEMEVAAQQKFGAGKTVVLDSYFNHETKKDDTGQNIVWHYQWNELANGGYALWGQVWRGYGAKTVTLSDAPTMANLKNASVYIIVDPDTEKETEKPNYIQPEHIKALSEWVKAGGVLVLMGNDFGNCEFDRFNELAKVFGVQFNHDSKNRVPGNQFEQGKITVPNGNEIFSRARTLYLKEISTLNLTAPAREVMTLNGDKVMAVSKYGKGTVFAVGDPWLYNEYTDGRKLPPDYQNFTAAQDLTRWLLAQTKR